MIEYKPHIPRTIGEVHDQLAFMFLAKPTFKDSFFVGQNLDTVFAQLNQGLTNIQKKIGEARYSMLVTLSQKARAHFEADPDDSNGEAREARRLVREMQTIIREKR